LWESNYKNINFQAVSVGVIFDINNWMTLRFNYKFDLASNKNNPGLLFVIGIAPDALNFLKSSK